MIIQLTQTGNFDIEFINSAVEKLIVVMITYLSCDDESYEHEILKRLHGL